MSSEKYFCQKCGKELKKNKKPCPYCGSTKVIITKNLSGNLIFHGFRKIGKILTGFRRYSIEIKTGWQPSRNKREHPEGVIKYQRFDRENPDKEDSYQEKIMDVKTGEICRDFKEPLRQHRG
jgi:DNA-directed RNA polymerase subunit RPC12/RpoP